MEMVMTNGFAELSAAEMEEIDGGSTDWGEIGYNIGNAIGNGIKSWTNFWGNVGGAAYDLFH